MAFQVKVVVDGGMEGREFLKGLHVPEFGHRRFPSSEWLVRVFRSIIEPAPAHMSSFRTYHPYCCAVGAQPVRDEKSGPPKAASWHA